MNLPVLTVVTDGGAWEAALVAEWERGEHGVSVVRRCVGVADLLAVASTGVAVGVVLPADLPHLDRAVLTRLAAAGVATVGLAGDAAAKVRLRALGVGQVLPTDASAGAVAGALRAAVAATGESTGDAPAEVPEAATAELVSAAPGRVVAVWGPTGAPGRSTVAVGLADEAARLGVETLLIDADTYGGVVGQMLGLLDEAPGLAAAARLEASGRLETASLAALARAMGPRLRVLTGISRAERWPEIGVEAMEGVLSVARGLATLTIVDCGFCLEQDEELSFDTAAPRRNAATLATLGSAEVVLAVGTADPVGLQRLIRGLATLREVVPAAEPQVVANRLRRGVVPGNPAREVARALQRFAGVEGVWTLPYDREAADRSLAAGRTLAEVAEGAALQRGLAELAGRLTGVKRPVRPVPVSGSVHPVPAAAAWPVRTDGASRSKRQ